MREQLLVRTDEDRNPPIINNHSKDRNAPITNSHGAAYNETQPIDIMKTSSKRSKRRDPHPCDNIVRQSINKLSYLDIIPRIPEVFFGRGLYPISCYPGFHSAVAASLHCESTNEVQASQIYSYPWVLIYPLGRPSILTKTYSRGAIKIFLTRGGNAI